MIVRVFLPAHLRALARVVDRQHLHPALRIHYLESDVLWSSDGKSILREQRHLCERLLLLEVNLDCTAKEKAG